MNAPKWLTADERATWLRVVAVLELLPAALDAQLHADAGLTQFEYMVLAMLSEAPERRLRMSELAAHTTATLPRLSRVVTGLENAGFVRRSPCAEDRRATNAELTEAGFAKLEAAAPGHVAAVRRHVVDAMAPEQLAQAGVIFGRMLETLDPDGRMLAGARLAAGDDPAGSGDATSSAPAHPLPRLAAPAMRSLKGAGYETLESLAGASAGVLIGLHGVGRSTLRIVREALDETGLEPLVE